MYNTNVYSKDRLRLLLINCCVLWLAVDLSALQLAGRREAAVAENLEMLSYGTWFLSVVDD